MIRLDLFLYFFAVVGIIVVMTIIHTWGDLPKNQTDDQLITEAIAEAIAVHEADPEAHMGVGESIDMHRKNDIIDHPASSIVSDKFSRKMVSFSDNFTDLSLWGALGNVSNSIFPTLEINPYYGGGLTAKVYAIPTIPTEPMNFSGSMTFSFWGYFEPMFSNTTMWASIGFESGLISSGRGMGFIVKNGKLYVTEYWTTGHEQLVDLGTTYLEGNHFFVMYFSLVDECIYFYVDGTLVASITPYNLAHVSESGISFGANIANTAGCEALMRIQDFNWTKDL